MNGNGSSRSRHLFAARAFFAPAKLKRVLKAQVAEAFPQVAALVNLLVASL
jgi:hypothetical protein